MLQAFRLKDHKVACVFFSACVEYLKAPQDDHFSINMLFPVMTPVLLSYIEIKIIKLKSKRVAYKQLQY